MNRPENAVKTYKSTEWVWFGILFLVVMEALFAWFLISYPSTIWGYVIFGIGAVIVPLSIIHSIVKHRNTIVVCPDVLRIEHAQRRTKDYEWEDLSTVDIEWSNIKRFSKETRWMEYYYYIAIEPTEGREYRFAVMEPTQFFLIRQLKKYHNQYRKSKQQPKRKQ